MKLSFSTPFASSNQEISPKTLILGALLVVGIAGLAAALNGGSALGASDFDSLITYLKANWLQSTFVIFLCVASLLGTLWQLLHGKGLGNLSTIILLLVVGVSGYAIINTAATATHVPAAMSMTHLLTH